MRRKLLRRKESYSNWTISFDAAKDILNKLKSDSTRVTVWHVFPEAESRLNGFVCGNNNYALLVRTSLKDDSGPFIASYLAGKGVRCVHYRFRGKSKAFRGLGENVLGFFFSGGSYVRVFYNTNRPVGMVATNMVARLLKPVAEQLAKKVPRKRATPAR